MFSNLNDFCTMENFDSIQKFAIFQEIFYHQKFYMSKNDNWWKLSKIGLRNCPGMTISRKVLLKFTAELITKFEITNLQDKIEIVPSDGGMMAPEKLKLHFKPLQK